MTLKQELETIMQYMPARRLDDVRWARLDELVKVDLVEAVARCIGPQVDIEITGNTRTGNKAHVPWVGIHDKKINSKSQSGVYISILFRVDGSGVVFSIQQGTDTFGLRDIREKVGLLRTEFGLPNERFTKERIRLIPTTEGYGNFNNNSRPARYEIANVLGIEYDATNIPDQVEDDLRLLFRAYQQWSSGVKNSIHMEAEEYQSADIDETVVEIENTDPSTRLDPRDPQYKAGTLHPSRDNRQGVIALVKAGYRCEVDSEHTTFVKENGKVYMEKHHLIPMERYFDFKNTVDHSKNIFSLCPMCHRKIHYGRREDKKELVERLYRQRADEYRRLYDVRKKKLLSFYGVR